MLICWWVYLSCCWICLVDERRIENLKFFYLLWVFKIKLCWFILLLLLLLLCWWCWMLGMGWCCKWEMDLSWGGKFLWRRRRRAAFACLIIRETCRRLLWWLSMWVKMWCEFVSNFFCILIFFLLLVCWCWEVNFCSGWVTFRDSFRKTLINYSWKFLWFLLLWIWVWVWVLLCFWLFFLLFVVFLLNFVFCLLIFLLLRAVSWRRLKS